MVAGPQETTERKRPARCCAAVVRGLGCRGCQHGRGGTLPVRFRSQSRSASLLRPLCCRFPRAALREREHPAEGMPLPVCTSLGRERRAGFASDAAPDKGPLTLPRRSGRAPARNGAPVGRATATRPAQGPRDTRRYRLRSPGAPDGKKRGSARRALPLVAFKSRPVDGRSGLELSPAPTGQSSIYRTRAAPWGDNTGVSPLYPGGLLHVVSGISGGF